MTLLLSLLRQTWAMNRLVRCRSPKLLTSPMPRTRCHTLDPACPPEAGTLASADRLLLRSCLGHPGASRSLRLPLRGPRFPPAVHTSLRVTRPDPFLLPAGCSFSFSFLFLISGKPSPPFLAPWSPRLSPRPCALVFAALTGLRVSLAFRGCQSLRRAPSALESRFAKLCARKCI